MSRALPLWIAFLGGLTFAGSTCSHEVAVEIEREPSPVELRRVVATQPKALCVPEPSPGPMRGFVGPMTKLDAWEPSCGGLLVASCELGVRCSRPGACACACEHDGDCRATAASVGRRYYAGHLAGLTGACEAGRCVWVAD